MMYVTQANNYEGLGDVLHWVKCHLPFVECNEQEQANANRVSAEQKMLLIGGVVLAGIGLYILWHSKQRQKQETEEITTPTPPIV